MLRLRADLSHGQDLIQMIAPPRRILPVTPAARLGIVEHRLDPVAEPGVVTFFVTQIGLSTASIASVSTEAIGMWPILG
jgi:hypothetical protein